MGQIRMGERFGFVAEQKHDIAGLGLRLEQLAAQAGAIDRVRILAAFQGMARPAPAESPFGATRLRAVSARCARRSALDLVGQARQRPVGPIRDGLRQNRLGHRKRASPFTGAGPGATDRPQRVDPTRHELTAPEPNRILAHAEGLGDPRAGPARQRQQDRPRPIRLAAIARVAQSHELTPLRGARDNRGFARHDPNPDPNQEMKSQTASVGHPAKSWPGRAFHRRSPVLDLLHGIPRVGSEQVIIWDGRKGRKGRPRRRADFPQSNDGLPAHGRSFIGENADQGWNRLRSVAPRIVPEFSPPARARTQCPAPKHL